MNKLLLTLGIVLLISGCSQEPTTSYLECQLTYKHEGIHDGDMKMLEWFEEFKTYDIYPKSEYAKPAEVIIDTANNEIRLNGVKGYMDYVFDTNYINNRDIIYAEDIWIVDGETEISTIYSFKLYKASGKAYGTSFYPNEGEDGKGLIDEYLCRKIQPIL